MAGPKFVNKLLPSLTDQYLPGDTHGRILLGAAAGEYPSGRVSLLDEVRKMVAQDKQGTPESFGHDVLIFYSVNDIYELKFSDRRRADALAEHPLVRARAEEFTSYTARFSTIVYCGAWQQQGVGYRRRRTEGLPS